MLVGNLWEYWEMLGLGQGIVLSVGGKGHAKREPAKGIRERGSVRCEYLWRISMCNAVLD